MKPIIEIVERMHHDLMAQKEEAIIKAVNKFDVVVDKERLLQALKDAKAFYQEGYYEGMSMGVSLFANIVHCKECEYYTDSPMGGKACRVYYNGRVELIPKTDNDFCSRGERRVE